MTDAPVNRPGEVAGWPKLVVKYRTDPGNIAPLLPPGLTPGASRAQWEEEMGRYWFDPDATTLAELPAIVSRGNEVAIMKGETLFLAVEIERSGIDTEALKEQATRSLSSIYDRD